MQLPTRWIRGALVLLLFAELICTVPWPWSHVPHKRPLHPAWVDADQPVQYNSTALLARSHAAMQYNRTSKQYETAPLAVYYGVDDLFFSKPAEGLATWLDVLVTANFPWFVHWAYMLAPQSWRVITEHTQRDLAIMHAGFPLLAPYNTSRPHFTQPERWALRQANWRPSDFGAEQYALCTAAVDDSTLQPVDWVTCSLHDLRVADSMENPSGHFSIHPDPPAVQACGMQPSSSAAAAAVAYSRGCPHLGPGLILGPLGRWVGQTAQRWRPAAIALRVSALVWQGLVPTGSIEQPLCPLFSQLHLLSWDRPLIAACAQALVLVTAARNWLYLITVAYKISRRLALLAPAPLPARLSGAALTFIGMFLGLWQSLSYTAIDAAFYVVLYKLVCFTLPQSSLAAVLAWRAWVFVPNYAVFRFAKEAWHRGKTAFKEARLLVLAPQVLLVNNQALAERLPRRQVKTVGTWPSPLVIPEEVDELPNSDIPRGFICPITQAIMRQPALLLHDHTIAPSTYDREAISQWLSEHSSDPKNPGMQLSMNSVKLVYNGDLGRSIEDWVATQLEQLRQQQQRQTRVAAWRRALSGHLDGRSLPMEGLPGEGVAAAAAGVLMQMRGGMGSGALAAPSPAAAAAAAEANVNVGDAAGLDRVGSAEAPPPQAAAAAGGAVQAAAAPPAAAPPAAAAGSGSILSGAGALVRTSSAALAQVASMDLPAVAAAGLHQLAGTTRRITTRALARQQQQGQPPQGAADGPQQQQQRQRRSTRQQQEQQQQQQQQQHEELDEAGQEHEHSGSESDEGPSGSSSGSEVDSSKRQRSTTPGGRAAGMRHRGSGRGASPAGVGMQPRRRQPRSSRL